MGSMPPSTPAKSLINLQLGWPSPRLFARDGLLKGAGDILTSDKETAAALIYGPHIGHPPLRTSLAEWLTTVYSPKTGPVSQDGIAITNGASGNLANVLQRFTDPLYTRKVFMVEPTYFLACPIFEDNGLQRKLRGVPENAEGLDIDFLRRALEATETAAVAAAKSSGRSDEPTVKNGATYPKIYKYVIYCVPTFANPSGKTFPMQTREKLVSLAREYDALVVSDDVYDFLHWPEDPKAPHDPNAAAPPRLVDVDRAMPGYRKWGNTLSNGSFSKLIGPGVRVGWADCAPALARELAEVGSSSSGGAPSHLTSTFVDKMLRSNYMQDFIRSTLVPTYRARYYVLMGAIKELLVPLGVTVEVNKPTDVTSEIGGGFFTYLRLPDDIPAAKTVAAFALKEYALRIAFGHMFTVTGDADSLARAEADGGFSRCVRLCWAWHEEGEIREGVERLAAAVRDVRDRVARGEDVGSQLSIGIR
ncbi:Uu.00g142760.m01.CDS01 [Anthostomella pinea]|uniref:Uu.00g142760.m01.CDS01 n=1 Tax=Anthostomella pinea TaxID=933095 RepID=A0AAI8VK22_9PEZI|nr:Uu.00g142760.m01.CDS01 [Anthostomella pinea]